MASCQSVIGKFNTKNSLQLTFDKFYSWTDFGEFKNIYYNPNSDFKQFASDSNYNSLYINIEINLFDENLNLIETYKSSSNEPLNEFLSTSTIESKHIDYYNKITADNLNNKYVIIPSIIIYNNSTKCFQDYLTPIFINGFTDKLLNFYIDSDNKYIKINYLDIYTNNTLFNSSSTTYQNPNSLTSTFLNSIIPRIDIRITDLTTNQVYYKWIYYRNDTIDISDIYVNGHKYKVDYLFDISSNQNTLISTFNNRSSDILSTTIQAPKEQIQCNINNISITSDTTNLINTISFNVDTTLNQSQYYINIFRNGIKIQTIGGENNSFDDYQITQNTSYDYQLQFETETQISELSSIVTSDQIVPTYGNQSYNINTNWYYLQTTTNYKIQDNVYFENLSNYLSYTNTPVFKRIFSNFLYNSYQINYNNLIRDLYQSLSKNTKNSNSENISTYYSSLSKHIKNFKNNIERFLLQINKIKSINNIKQNNKLKILHSKNDTIYSEIEKNQTNSNIDNKSEKIIKHSNEINFYSNQDQNYVNTESKEINNYIDNDNFQINTQTKKISHFFSNDTSNINKLSKQEIIFYDNLSSLQNSNLSIQSDSNDKENEQSISTIRFQKSIYDKESTQIIKQKKLKQYKIESGNLQEQSLNYKKYFTVFSKRQSHSIYQDLNKEKQGIQENDKYSVISPYKQEIQGLKLFNKYSQISNYKNKFLSIYEKDKISLYTSSNQEIQNFIYNKYSVSQLSKEHLFNFLNMNGEEFETLFGYYILQPVVQQFNTTLGYIIPVQNIQTNLSALQKMSFIVKNLDFNFYLDTVQTGMIDIEKTDLFQTIRTKQLVYDNSFEIFTKIFFDRFQTYSMFTSLLKTYSTDKITLDLIQNNDRIQIVKLYSIIIKQSKQIKLEQILSKVYNTPKSEIDSILKQYNEDERFSIFSYLISDIEMIFDSILIKKRYTTYDVIDYIIKLNNNTNETILNLSIASSRRIKFNLFQSIYHIQTLDYGFRVYTYLTKYKYPKKINMDQILINTNETAKIIFTINNLIK